MILSRIAHHLKTQNWTAIAIEFVIVITGVVIGFQVTAWNEARLERQSEALILERLQADFTAIEARTAEARDALGNSSASGRRLADLVVSDPDTLDEAAFRTALAGAIGTQVPTGRSATYVELLASGEMRLIRSESLRAALVAFDEQVRRQELAYDSLAEIVTGDAAILLAVQALIQSSETPLPERYLDELAAWRASPEFLVAARLMITVNAINQRWHSETHDRAGAVLGALSEGGIQP